MTPLEALESDMVKLETFYKSLIERFLEPYLSSPRYVIYIEIEDKAHELTVDLALVIAINKIYPNHQSRFDSLSAGSLTRYPACLRLLKEAGVLQRKVEEFEARINYTIGQLRESLREAKKLL